MSRRRSFLAATLVLPVALLLVAEAALRSLGLGGRPPLFVEEPEAPGWLVPNPRVMARYLPAGGPSAATIQPIHFRREKPEAGYRIVVQGGSTAAGFPYGRWGGLAGMLGDRLESAFPEREIEVTTTAMAAVNSYALLDLVDEIIAVRPDAVLVYAGHNEYLGILGSGSALHPAASAGQARLQLVLNRLGLYRALERLLAATRPERADRNTLFARAAEGARIPLDSDAYRAGVRQLEVNLGALLAKYRDAGIPVYLGTLVSNEKDLPPFASAEGEDSAASWFERGRSALAVGRVEEARAAFLQAKDRDELRFRAPEDFDGVIRELAARHHARLVDVREHLRRASPDGLLGHELLLEHVHPNAAGYFLLADAYYQALVSDGVFGDASGAPSVDDARRDMPITRVDRMLAEYDRRELLSGFPFADPPRPFALPPARSEIERLAQRLRAGEADWAATMDALEQLHLEAGRMQRAARVARLVAQAYPMHGAPNLAAARLLARTGRPALARRYLRRCLDLDPGDPEALDLVRALDAAPPP